MDPRYIARSEEYNSQINELMFQAGVKGMNEQSELIPCYYYYSSEVLYYYLCALMSNAAAYWSTWFKLLVKPSQETTHYLLTHFSWLWYIVNNVGFIQNTVMRAVYFCKFHLQTQV